MEDLVNRCGCVGVIEIAIHRQPPIVDRDTNGTLSPRPSVDLDTLS